MKIHTHPINELFEEVKNLNYPDNIKKVPALLSNFAFFPGGTGLWKTTSDQDWPQIPKGGVMVLAHNFGSTKYYDKCHEEWGGDNLNSATWRNLSDLLEKTSVDLGKCFFTNVYFGLRTDDKETGFFPGSKNQDYRKKCQEIFQKQVEIQKPRLILSLGQHNIQFLSEISTKLASWHNCKKRFKILDLSDIGPVVNKVSFNSCPNIQTVVVVLLHPCYRKVNIKHRSYPHNSQSENDPEIDMINEGKRLAGL